MFGVTRQRIGGDYSIIPGSSTKKAPYKWFVPFQGCKLPPFIVPWPAPITEPNAATILDMFGPCRENVLGDPAPGIIMPNPGPLSAPGQIFAALDSGRRTFVGRIRQAGSDLRTILYSPMYTGPAFITQMLWGGTLQNSGGRTDSWLAGVIPGSGTSVFKVPAATAGIPPGSFLDASGFSDNESPVPGLTTLFEVQGAANNIQLSTLVPWPTFSIWVLFQTISAGASAIDFQISFAPAVVTAGGVQSAQGQNQFNARTYLGGPG